MAQEKEIKIELLIPQNVFIKRVKAQNFRYVTKKDQLDVYFDTPDWILYKSLAALRLRYVDKKPHSFSFKKLFFTPKRKDKYYIEEIEISYSDGYDENTINDILEKLQVEKSLGVDLSDPNNLTAFLKNTGYQDDQKVKKTRRVFQKNHNQITIDNIEKVGLSIELECRNDEPLEVVKSILAKDEWERSVEGASYRWLKKVKGFTSHLDGLKRFEDKPDWNVWKREKKMYKKINKK